MPIFNIAQANFLFRKGAKVLNIIEGKKGEMGILFDKHDDKFDTLMEEWKKMTEENRKRKGLIK